MWPFGRKKNTTDHLSCAICGRTLLAGEWTQRIVTDDGDEQLICSLCSQSLTPETDTDTVTVSTSSNGTPRVRGSARDSDSFWRALKEKDAQIERLEARLARVEAERQELAAELAALRAEGTTAPSHPQPPVVPSRSPEPGGDTADWPAPLVEADAAGPSPTHREAASDDQEATLPGSPLGLRDAQPEAGEATAGGAVVSTTENAALSASASASTEEGVSASASASTDGSASASTDGHEATIEDTVAQASSTAPSQITDDQAEAEWLSEETLHLLQRGVDLLNVSPVPKKIAETSESLGVPFAHVRAEGDDRLSVTFLWNLGWYRFDIELSGAGSVRLADRGYEELADVQPNASVRSDGTVQLAPTFGKRPTPKAEGPNDTPNVASVTSGVIIAKSLMGQRTDDEPIGPWEGATPRDFDWGR